jgi:hypothetical protein
MAEEDKKRSATSKRHFLVTFVSGFLLVIILGGMVWSHRDGMLPQVIPTPTSQQNQTKIAADIFRYPGKDGVDALSLLKEQVPIEQDTSGLVVSINHHKADNTKKEYWSFFVNGKMAEVGPADYITKNSDQIEWRIEIY